VTVISVMKFNDHEGALISDSLTTIGGEKDRAATKVRSFEMENFNALVGLAGNADFLHEVMQTAAGFNGIGKIEKGKELADALSRIMNSVRHKFIEGYLQRTYAIEEVDAQHGFRRVDDGKFELRDEIIKDYFTLARGIDEHSHATLTDGDLLLVTSDDINIYIIASAAGASFVSSRPYRSIGGGRSVADYNLTEFYESTSREQRNNIPPTDGLAALIRAVDKASMHTMGVEGTPMISILHPEEGIIMPNANNTHLATEIVRAEGAGLLPIGFRREAIDTLLYKKDNFAGVEREMYRNATNRKKLDRFLRGYQV
jgi:hypothetical protein